MFQSVISFYDVFLAGENSVRADDFFSTDPNDYLDMI